MTGSLSKWSRTGKYIRMIPVRVGVGRNISTVMEDEYLRKDILHISSQYGILSVRNAYILTEVIICQ